jgi:hypothetical protein
LSILLCHEFYANLQKKLTACYKWLRKRKSQNTLMTYSEEYDFVFPLSWKELKSFDNKQAAYNYAEEYLRKKRQKERRNAEYF